MSLADARRPAARGRRAAEPPPGGRGPALRAQPPGAHRDVHGRHRRHVLRDAVRPVSSDRAGTGWGQGVGAPLYRSRGGLLSFFGHERLDQPCPSARHGRDRRRHDLGPRDHRFWPGTRSLAGALVPRPGRRRRHDERRLPVRDLEPDDPGLAAGQAGGDRDDQLHIGPGAGQSRGGRGCLALQRAGIGRLGRRAVRRGCLLAAIALPVFRTYDARLYHLAPEHVPDSVKRE